MRGRERQKQAPAPRGCRKAGRSTAAEGENPVRPAQCRTYLRRTLSRELPAILDGFVEQAKAGSCQHLKLVTELLQLGAKAKRPPSGKPTLRKLLRELENGRVGASAVGASAVGGEESRGRS